MVSVFINYFNNENSRCPGPEQTSSFVSCQRKPIRAAFQGRVVFLTCNSNAARNFRKIVTSDG